MHTILRAELGDAVVQHEPLAGYTTLKVGGPADWLYRANNARALQKAVEVARRCELPYRVIGGASNVLVSDEGLDGLVILNRSKRFFVRPARGDGVHLVADSGVSLPWLAGTLARGGVTGLEWCVGVPGTIGGAVVQNAGAWGHEIRDTLVSIEWLTSAGEVETVSAGALDLRYRHSIVLEKAPQERPVILRATFALGRDKPEEIRKRVRYYSMRRTMTQPRAASGGSTFKNPPGDYAGRLLEEAGLKGYRIGGAEFSPTHANFIVNRGDATAQDVMALIVLARRRVRAQFDVHLELELEYVGRWAEEPAAETARNQND